jgi:WD40 repeat protein
VGHDKNVVFYDINDKVIVKRIKTETPLQSVSFCADGHTIAIGASNFGAILVYDLRKSSKEVAKICTGHMSTINSLRFTNKVIKDSEKQSKTKENAKEVTAEHNLKSIEQIREEAARRAAEQ